MNYIGRCFGKRALSSASNAYAVSSSRLVAPSGSLLVEKQAWRHSLSEEEDCMSTLKHCNNNRQCLDGLVVPSISCCENGQHAVLNPVVVPCLDLAVKDGWKETDDSNVEVTASVNETRITSRTMIDSFVSNKVLALNSNKRMRVKPIRDRRYRARECIMEKTELTKKMKALRKRVARALEELRVPQLKDDFRIVTNRTGYLGEGRQGIVRKCTKIKSGDGYAVKMCSKYPKFQKSEDIRNVRDEVAVLRRLNHPNVLHLIEAYESPLYIHIVTEDCRGGDLFSFLNRNEFQPQGEYASKYILKQLLEGIAFCHDEGVAHLDLKLENLMRRNDGPEIESSPIVIADFGHSKPIPTETVFGSAIPTGRLARPVGSPSYSSPEVVLECTYSDRSDMWSIGVITYVLLHGYLPYPQLQLKQWRDFTVADYSAPHNSPFRFEMDWKHVSPEAYDFVLRSLQVEAENRMTVKEAMEHPWMKMEHAKEEAVIEDPPMFSSLFD